MVNAVRSSNSSAVKAFIDLSAVKQLSSEAVAELLHTAATRSSWLNGRLLEPLSKLSAAQHVTSEAVARLLCSATGRFIKHRPDLRSELKHVCDLPGAKQMPPDLLVTVLHAAVQLQHSEVIDWLSTSVISVAQLGCHNVAQLLELVVRRAAASSSVEPASDALTAIDALCKLLPAVQQVVTPAARLAQVLKKAASPKGKLYLHVLERLRALGRPIVRMMFFRCLALRLRQCGDFRGPAEC
jgi:hypothetical protein